MDMLQSQIQPDQSHAVARARLWPALASICFCIGCNGLSIEQHTIAEFETTYGSFAFELRDDVAPQASAAMAAHVNSGFYNTTVIHEVAAGHIAIGGFVRAELVEKPAGEPIALETAARLSNARGTIAMARAEGADSATSQFFFNLADNASLDPSADQPGFAVFGVVAEGQDVIDAIAALPTAADGQLSDVPIRDVAIRSTARIDSSESAAGRISVAIDTTLGRIVASLDPASAPGTVENFLQYVDSGFYRGTLFHRVEPGFVVQGGGFVRAYAPKAAFDSIANESLNDLKNVRESIALESASDQIFNASRFRLNLTDNPQFDAQGGQLGFPVFGSISSGREVLARIAVVETAQRGDLSSAPIEDILIISAQAYSIPVGLDTTLWTNADFAASGNAAVGVGRDMVRTLIYYAITSPGN